MSTTDRNEVTGWTGWVVFAAVMLMIAGVMQAFYGVVALFNDEWVVWGQEAALLLDITAWGWVDTSSGALWWCSSASACCGAS